MKSYHTTLSPYRRALIAAAVVLATGSVAALAQSSGQDSTNGSNTGNYQSTENNNNMSSTNATATNGNDATSPNNATTTDKDNDNDRATSSDRNSSKLSWSDRHFITKAAEDNQHEIEAAQIAADKATNPDVKNFAQHMVQEHQQVGQELQQLASSKDVKLNEVKENRADKKLSKASGDAFDRDFVKQMVSDHKKVIKEFQSRAENAKDADLKAFAQKTLPNLQHHLEMAQQLEQSIVPTGRTGNSSWKAPTDTNDTNASSSTNTSNSAATPNANGTTTGSTSSTSH